MKRLKARNIEVVVYEPVMREENFFNSRVVRNFDEFKQISDMIVSNRMMSELDDVGYKVYIRELLGSD